MGGGLEAVVAGCAVIWKVIPTGIGYSGVAGAYK